MEGAAIHILVFFLLFVRKSYAAELNTISESNFLTDGDTLVSADGIFELGFFTPGSSQNRYLGIWYKKISDKTVVWVANRDHPLPGASPLVLKIADQGILRIFSNTTMIWSYNTTTSGKAATILLRDDGNLVVIDQQERVLWQSFDYPTDTLLPGMKIGRDYVRRKEWYLSSWKSSEDPAPGELTYRVNKLGYPENNLKQGALVIFRGEPWRNRTFSGGPVLGKSLTVRYDVIISESEVSNAYKIEDSSILSRATLNSSMHIEIWAWVDNARGWKLALSLPSDLRVTYNMCGAYGTSSVDVWKQSCNCLGENKFVPKNQKGWDKGDWSGGCIRRTPLECKNGLEGFIKYTNVKFPATENAWFNMSLTLEECHTKCLQNCSCMAYANPDDSQSICVLWFNDLLDLQAQSEGLGGSAIFVRIASSELDSQSISKNHKIILLVVIPAVVLIGLIIATSLCYARRIWNHAKPAGEGEISIASRWQEEDMEQPLFSFSTIADATANFSHENKLGEGGFGPVYKITTV